MKRPLSNMNNFNNTNKFTKRGNNVEFLALKISNKFVQAYSTFWKNEYKIKFQYVDGFPPVNIFLLMNV